MHRPSLALSMRSRSLWPGPSPGWATFTVHIWSLDERPQFDWLTLLPALPAPLAAHLLVFAFCSSVRARATCMAGERTFGSEGAFGSEGDRAVVGSGCGVGEPDGSAVFASGAPGGREAWGRAGAED